MFKSCRDLIEIFSILNRINYRHLSTVKVQNKLVHNEIDPNKFKHLINVNSNTDVTKCSIDLILKEYEYLKYMTNHVPSDLSSEQMLDLLQIESEHQRRKYFRYLFLNEIRKQRDLNKRKSRKDNYQKFIETRNQRAFGIFDQNEQLIYQLWSNSLLGRISSQNLSYIRTTQRLRYASMFGQKLIIDLDYDDFMSLSECRIQVNHIVRLLVDNLRSTREPFDIYFTNCDYNKPTMKHLCKYFDQMPFRLMSINDRFLTDHYLNKFDRENLVYLSPNANETLMEYNHNDIYIIGGFLDKSNLNKPISFIKSSKENLRQYRLPLDEYVQWGSGSSKNLCIMHMVSILNHVKQTNDWSEAFRLYLPKRKMKNLEKLKQELDEQHSKYMKRKMSIENFMN